MSAFPKISVAGLSISELRRAAMVADEYVNSELVAGNGGLFSERCTLTAEQVEGIVYMLRHLRTLTEQLEAAVDQMCQGRIDA